MNSYNKKYQMIEIYGLLLLDLVCITISYFVAYSMRFSGISGLFGGESSFQKVYMLILIVCLIYNTFADGYHHFFRRGLYEEFNNVLKYHIVLVLFTGSFIYVLRLELEYSRLVLAYFAVISFLLTYFIRIGFKRFMAIYYPKSRNSDKIMVITTSEELPRVMEHIKRDSSWSYEITSIAIMDEDRIGEEVDGIPIIATRDNLIEIAKRDPLDVVFLNYPTADLNELEVIVQSFQAMGITCHNCVERLAMSMPCNSVGKFASMAVMTYSMNVVDYRMMLLKRIMDILGGIVGLAIMAVFFPFVAVLIKIESPGPIFFAQQRIGKNGRRFKMYKFRSMYKDAEKRKKDLMKENEIKGPMFKMERDPRITKVGNFLRKTSIDELPQFYNILKGDMSLVGTRPPTEDEFEKYNVYYRRRLSITPGLTGMWQVSGRSDIKDFDEVVKLDLKYIDEWSLGMDVKLLVMTIGAVFFGRGSK